MSSTRGGRPAIETPVIDCDVHHSIARPDDLHPYLPRVYRDRVADQGLLLPVSGYLNLPKLLARAEATGSTGAAGGTSQAPAPPGQDYEQLRRDHLDHWGLDRALLTGGSTYAASLEPDPDHAGAVCRAFNDWTLEHWAARDERLLVAVAVAVNDPVRAVEEVHRLAGHPQVAAIVLPTGARVPYGNRFYHPVWRACEETGLVVVVHPGAEGAGMAGPPTGVGYPSYHLELRMARPQMAMAHAASFIAEGVFEKFPRLKVLFNECDQFWAVGLMWHMDADWKSLREQTPWVKRLPSEYLRGHIRIGSHPALEPAERCYIMLDAMHAEETLVYASDWPQWRWDDPASTRAKLPERLHRRVLAENAKELFGLR